MVANIELLQSKFTFFRQEGDILFFDLSFKKVRCERQAHVASAPTQFTACPHGAAVARSRGRDVPPPRLPWCAHYERPR